LTIRQLSRGKSHFHRKEIKADAATAADDDDDVNDDVQRVLL